jgi:SAM-dependent methyltransferase
LDARTFDYYALHAREVAQRYAVAQSGIARYVAAAFVQGSRILDIGAGSGRDLAALLASGFEAYGVEPVPDLVAQAVALHPQLCGRIERAALPAIGKPFGGDFDGILCSAVLMHIAESDLFDTVFALRGLLRRHGRLLVSLPLARDDVDVDERDIHGRLFKTYRPEYLQLLFERVGFQLIGRWESHDGLGRAGVRWYTLLFELRAGSALRAVDRIEGILNRDRKVATYKLALFRALAELATQEPRVAAWRPDGTVGVPIRRISEKWLQYYWPIFASPQLMPQSQAEGVGTRQPVKFRKAMAALMAPYAGSGEHGGLSAWQLAASGGQLSLDVRRNLETALRRIAEAIRDGPVRHSGGSLETGAIFAHDPADGTVIMDADVWRELSLLGHWIIDAVILRWAELTERFGHRVGIRTADVLPLLIARPEPERATRLARQIFLAHGPTVCTWSDRKLTADFAVDHVIPFSLWGSNDLWNLLPVDPRVNGEKSDRLPTADLLRERQVVIVGNWQMQRDAVPEAFDQQAAHLLGRRPRGPLNWENDLFASLREAIELTALHRGVERWAPGQKRARPPARTA